MMYSDETKLKNPHGNKGKIRTQETKDKISKSLSGDKHPFYNKHLSVEHRLNISKANSGKKHTQETKDKISNSLKGRKAWNKGKKMWDTKPNPMTGVEPWNKGKEMTEEFKQKVSESLMGKKLSAETKLKISKNSPRLSGPNHPMYGKKLTEKHKKKISNGVKGEKHPNWKGGITPKNIKIRTSNIYDAWRIEVFKRDSFFCQLCGINRKDIQAHHILPFRNHKNDLLVYDINNGITLCSECHMAIAKHENEFINLFNAIVVESGAKCG